MTVGRVWETRMREDVGRGRRERTETTRVTEYRGVADRPVSTIMSTPVVASRPDTPEETLWAAFIDRGVGSVVVLADAGRPVGIVTRSDLLRRRFENRHGEEWSAPQSAASDLEPGFQLASVSMVVARDVMSPLAFWLPPDAPIGFAAAMMAHERIGHLPVLNRGLVGIVAARDVLQALAQEEGYVMAGPRATSRTNGDGSSRV